MRINKDEGAFRKVSFLPGHPNSKAQDRTQNPLYKTCASQGKMRESGDNGKDKAAKEIPGAGGTQSRLQNHEKKIDRRDKNFQPYVVFNGFFAVCGLLLGKRRNRRIDVGVGR